MHSLRTKNTSDEISSWQISRRADIYQCVLYASAVFVIVCYLQSCVVETCSHICQSFFSKNPLSTDSEIQGNAAKWD